MLYAQLVARIAKVSRTLVLRGKSGKFEQNSTIFTAEVDVREIHDHVGRSPVEPGEAPLAGHPAKMGKVVPRVGWLKICDGAAMGCLFRVVRIVGSEVHVTEPFPATETGVAWELYDAGISEEDVRKVLRAFPDVLMECEEGDQVRTYLGVIKIVRRKRKRVKDRQGRWTFSPERLQARLRPGKRLQRSLEGDSSESSTSPRTAPSEDEDPSC